MTPTLAETGSGSSWLDAAHRLRTQDLPHALVSVLRVQAPASARPGDKAVVTADGIVAGWIGGGCAQPAVQRAVRAALADGRARLIRITPAEDGALRELDDVLEFGMACHSGGTLELFVDPVLPRERLTIIGDTPLAVALAGLAPRVGLPVTVIANGADTAAFPDAERLLAEDLAAADLPKGGWVVVATQGRRDIGGLRLALAAQARCVWFVASARKARVLKDALVTAGSDPTAVEAIVAPAGQSIGAQTPAEIALAVLAEVVAARRRGVPAPNAAAPAPAVEAHPGPGTEETATAPTAEPIASPVPVAAPASCCGGGR